MGRGYTPDEYSDYLMMKHVYRCPPSVFDLQPHYIVEFHKEVYSLEIRMENLRQKKEKLKAETKASLNKFQ